MFKLSEEPQFGFANHTQKKKKKKSIGYISLNRKLSKFSFIHQRGDLEVIWSGCESTSVGTRFLVQVGEVMIRSKSQK